MDSEKHKRLLREQRERRLQHRQDATKEAHAAQQEKPVLSIKHSGIYHDHYKSLLIITFGILFLSLCVIGYTYVKTGDFFYKGVSLSGGITITVSTSGIAPVDVTQLESRLRTEFPDSDLSVREISNFGTQNGFSIEATTQTNTRESLDNLTTDILASIPQVPDIHNRASTELTGPTLGASFFQQAIKAVMIAFVFMGLVVFIYFGDTVGQKALTATLSLIEAIMIWYANSIILTLFALAIGAVLVSLYIKHSIPSTAVILAAASTIIFTIAVVDLLQMRLSTAGIAAFLMLIGYSVDTDILLSTRVLKSHVGTVYERIVGTMKTGLTMTGTTFCAALISFVFTQSSVIKEIMIIILIGLIADVFNTWVQNSGILRWYLEKHGRKSDDS